MRAPGGDPHPTAVGAGDLDLLRVRVRAALELVHDPAAQAYKTAPAADVPPLGPEDLKRRYIGIINHVWALLKTAYGIRLGQDFYAVHLEGDRLNCVALTPDADAAESIRRWWPGTAPLAVSAVTAVERVPEAWVAMGVALHWKAPAWMAADEAADEASAE